MPANTYTAHTTDLQSPPVDLEAVSHLFEAKGIELLGSLVARIAGLLPRLDTAEEVLEGFVDIGDDDLEDVTVDAFASGRTSLSSLTRLSCSFLVTL